MAMEGFRKHQADVKKMLEMKAKKDNESSRRDYERAMELRNYSQIDKMDGRSAQGMSDAKSQMSRATHHRANSTGGFMAKSPYDAELDEAIF